MAYVVGVEEVAARGTVIVRRRGQWRLEGSHPPRDGRRITG